MISEESYDIKQAIRKVMEGASLTVDEAAAAMRHIMEGNATDAQIGSFITALRMKGETVEEITGCAQIMREKAQYIEPGKSDYRVVDTCGTGGDVSGTFNISTASALLLAGGGITVAKHGNRSVSSNSGSADVLKELGVNIEAPDSAVEECLREAKIGFLYAPLLHAAMKYAIGPRRQIGARTVFNILGPLTNPSGAKCQVLGVYDGALTSTLAGVLRNLGSEHCMVVHGCDGLDEITLCDETQITELNSGELRDYRISPEQFGLQRCDAKDLVVGSPAESAEAIREVLKGKAGHHRDIVQLNAAAGFVVSGAAEDMEEGLRLAGDSIDSGRAQGALEKLIEITNRN